jgi:sulfotransferase family protein
MTQTPAQQDQQVRQPQKPVKTRRRSSAATDANVGEVKRIRYLLSKTLLRIPLYWIRHQGLGPNDVFFGSYPRSGSTWSRFVLCEILTGREADFDVVNATMRGVHRRDHGLPTLPHDGRVLGSHEQYRRQYKRAFYLVRDARDVALSEYAYLKALGFFRGNMDEFLLKFLGVRGRINGFGPWQKHVASWLDSPIAGTDKFTFVRFEDLRQKPEETFSRISEFLGVKPDPQVVKRAVANNSLKRMQEKERLSPQLPKDAFVRTGSVQGWREKLTKSQVEMIEEHAGSALLRLGYPLAAQSLEPVASY